MRDSVILESSEIKQMIARFLGIPAENVLPTKYSFSVIGLSTKDIEGRLQ